MASVVRPDPICVWHATEYLAEAAEAIFPTKKAHEQKKEWLDASCHKLKHLKGAAGRILKELKQQAKNIRGKIRLEKLHKAICYFTHQKSRMNYYALVRSRRYRAGSLAWLRALKSRVKMSAVAIVPRQLRTPELRG